MAKCATLSSFTIDLCKGSLGGIKKVYIADWQNGAAILDDETKEITGFTTGVTFTEFPIRKNTGSYTSTINVSDENGNSVSTVLSLVFSRMETAKRLAMNALMVSDFMCIVEDANGNQVFLGYDNPVVCSDGGGETGTAKTDGNRYTISLTDDSVEFPYFIKAGTNIPTTA